MATEDRPGVRVQDSLVHVWLAGDCVRLRQGEEVDQWKRI